MESSIRSSAWVLAVAVALAVPVFAQSTDAQAKRLALEGKKAFDTQDFATAIARYNDAYKLKAAPGLLFNLGQCYRKTGELETALSYFRRYLETNPPSAQAKATDTVIAEVQTQLEERQKAEADRRAAEEAEAARAREALAAEQKAKADALRVAAAKAEAEAAQQKLQLELTRRQEAAPPPVTSRWWFWATIVGVVAAGATVGTVAATSPKPVQTNFPDINAR